MLLLNMTEAAEAAGVDRSTIYRKIKAGELSTTLDATGEKRLSTDELLRVFGRLVAPNVASDSVEQQHATPSNIGDTELVATLKDQLRVAQDQLRTAEERERWLMGMLESAQAQLALPPAALDQLKAAEERERRLLDMLESARSSHTKGWLARLLGR